MVEASLKWLKENPSESLSEIQFTSNEESMVKVFEAEFKKRFGKEETFHGGLHKKTKPGIMPETIPQTSGISKGRKKTIHAKGGVQIQVKVGDIARQRVSCK